MKQIVLKAYNSMYEQNRSSMQKQVISFHSWKERNDDIADNASIIEELELLLYHYGWYWISNSK